MKRISINNLLRYLIIGILLPLFIQYVIYFRFTSNYMRNIFSEEHFNDFYGKTVFRYRVLGKTIHLWVYHQLKKNPKTSGYKEQDVYEKRLTALDPDADPVFHLTYFIEATIFSILTALALLYLFDSGAFFDISEMKKILITSGLIMLAGFLEFVITPYDHVTYFFMVLCSLLFLKFLQKRQWIYFVLLNLSIILATSNHESSLIILSFMMAVYLTHYGFNLKRLSILVLPVACYLLTYLGLRLLIKDEGSVAVAQKFMLWQNLGLAGMMGFLFVVISFYILFKLTRNPVNKKLLRNFLLTASPYMIIIPFIGIMVEVRLWMPVIIGGVLISQLNLRAISFPAAEESGKKENKYSLV